MMLPQQALATTTGRDACRSRWLGQAAEARIIFERALAADGTGNERALDAGS
jgi:hypothetical protein